MRDQASDSVIQSHRRYGHLAKKKEEEEEEEDTVM